jgi:hypothetical protein
MRTDITASQEEMKAGQEKMEAYQEKMEVAIKCGQEEMKATVRASQKRCGSTISSIRSELEETMKNRVEDVLSSVDTRHRASAKNLTRRLKKRSLAYKQSTRGPRASVMR